MNGKFGVGAVVSGEGSQFSKKQVRSALADVVASNQFKGSPQLVDFLTYIVEETLAGRQADLKAYSIAIDALGRSENFDSQTNPVVRVAAGRLRQTLTLYYAAQNEVATVEGNDSSVIITLEPGSYVPIFQSGHSLPAASTDSIEVANKTASQPISVESAGAQSVDAANGAGNALQNETESVGDQIKMVVIERRGIFQKWRRSILVALALLASIIGGIVLDRLLLHPSTNSADDIVLTQNQKLALTDIDIRPKIKATFVFPDKPYPDWFSAGETGDSIVLAMARFNDYQFLGAISADRMPTDDEREADYHLVVTIYRRGDDVRFFARLLRGQDEDIVIIWSITRLFKRPAELEDRSSPNIAGLTYAPVASPYGVIYSDLVKTGALREKLDCVVAAYAYFSSKSDARHARARKCGEDLVAKGSLLPSIYALLTFLYLDEYRENRNRLDRDPLAAADNAAQRAVQLGPASARALQAAFAVEKVRGNYRKARQVGLRAIQANPFDTDVVGDYGAWLVSIGEIEEGAKYLERVDIMLEAHPAWFDVFSYLVSEMTDDFKTADQLGKAMDAKRSPMMAMTVLLAAARNGDATRANQALLQLNRDAPDLAITPRESLMKRGFSKDMANRLADRILAAIDSTKRQTDG